MTPGQSDGEAGHATTDHDHGDRGGDRLLLRAFAALAWLIGTSGLIGAATMWLAGVSLLLGVFNLLPGAPLDGGRVLRAVLWGHYRDRARASDASARVGRAIGFAFVALGVLEFLYGAVAGLWLALIGWFMLSGAAGERYLALMERVRGLSVRDVMTAPPTLALSWQTVSDFVATSPPNRPPGRSSRSWGSKASRRVC